MKRNRGFARVAPVAPSRRSFLRSSVGGALALPAMASLLPRTARAASTAPKRLFYFFLPNGMHMPDWTPTQEGASFDLPPILQPLAPFQSQSLVVSGLSNYGALEGFVGHDGGTGGFLSCASINPLVLTNGTSVDQIAAASLRGITPFGSLETGMESASGYGVCPSQTCAYKSSISWADATTPRPKITEPHVLFERLFGSLDPALDAGEVERRRSLRLSVLDRAVGQAKALSGKLSAGDKLKLDAYLTSVRDLELQVQTLALATCESGDAPAAELGFPEAVRATLDLLVLAFSCDLTRVSSFMLGNGASNRSHEHLGIYESHHDLSHHANDPVKQALVAQINVWEMGEVAYLLQRLAETQGADGESLLDSTLVTVSSELADGHLHENFNLPMVVVGGGSTLQTGQHLRVQDGALADLHLAVLEGFGVVETTLGVAGAGPLPGVLS